MNLNPIAGIIEAVGSIAGDLITTDKERAEIALKERELDVRVMEGQMAVNAVEAANTSVFVAGWRPAIGWVGACAMAYQFLLYPFLTWGWKLMQAWAWVPVDLAPPPMLNTDALWVILTGMLGVAGARTFEKIRGVAR